MNAKKGFILLLLIIFVKNQVPTGMVINSCGKIGYDTPDKSDCVQENEICCYVQVTKKDDSSVTKSFCASAPSNIKLEEIAEDFGSTDYKLEALVCNNSYKLINDFATIIFLLTFILF